MVNFISMVIANRAQPQRLVRMFKVVPLKVLVLIIAKPEIYVGQAKEIYLLIVD